MQRWPWYWTNSKKTVEWASGEETDIIRPKGNSAKAFHPFCRIRTHHLSKESGWDWGVVWQLQSPCDISQHGNAAKVQLGSSDRDRRSLANTGQEELLWRKEFHISNIFFKKSISILKNLMFHWKNVKPKTVTKTVLTDLFNSEHKLWKREKAVYAWNDPF